MCIIGLLRTNIFPFKFILKRIRNGSDLINYIQFAVDFADFIQQVNHETEKN